jgi:2-methylisocitrate lyase-like PEP mutase family enzyme
MAKHVKVPVFANTIPYKNALRKLPCQYRRPGVKSVSIPSQMEFAITT